MSDTKHTPTPWKRIDLFPTLIWADDNKQAQHWIATTNVDTVASSAEEKSANAELIVKAVNSYQPMLDVLLVLRRHYTDNASLELIDSVISLAEGKTK